MRGGGGKEPLTDLTGARTTANINIDSSTAENLRRRPRSRSPATAAYGSPKKAAPSRTRASAQLDAEKNPADVKPKAKPRGKPALLKAAGEAKRLSMADAGGPAPPKVPAAGFGPAVGRARARGKGRGRLPQGGLAAQRRLRAAQLAAAAPAAPALAAVAVPARNAPLYNDTAVYQGLAERDATTQQLINGIRALNAQLPAAPAVTIGNQPNGRMSMQFGSTFMQDRRIIIPGGRIETNGFRVTITARKTPDAITRITAFLTTEFPFGGKVGGVLFALVSLIPRVIKGLPGTVVITS